MKNKTFTLTNRQFDWLAGLSAHLEVPESEVLRRFLDERIDGVSLTAPLAAPQIAKDDSADKRGTKLIRVRAASRDRLNEFVQRTGVSQIDIISRILDLTDEQLVAVITGRPADLPSVELGKRYRIPLPIGTEELTPIDFFLSEYCVTAPDLSVPIQPVYTSYVEYCDRGLTVETQEQFVSYIDQNCSVNVITVNRPMGLFGRIALRPHAHAVLMGEVTGIEATE